MTVAVISEQASELEKLCVRYYVERLDLFGSAASGSHGKGASDLDFLVEFPPLPAGAYADDYFGLLEALEILFGSPVDLVVDSAIRNPFFRQRVEETRTQIYCGLRPRSTCLIFAFRKTRNIFPAQKPETGGKHEQRLASAGGEGALQRAAGSQSCRRTADCHQVRERSGGAGAD